MSETSLMKVGAVGVDSGRIMLLDPCNEGKRTGDAAAHLEGVRSIRRGSVEIGVMVETPGGDGVFPVIAEIVDGELNGILLDFGDEDLEKGILGARMIARGEEAPEIVEAAPALRDNPHLTDEQRAAVEESVARQLEPKPAPDGWQGTEPAQGTRRHAIYLAIGGALTQFEEPEGSYESRTSFALKLADAVESVLLKLDIGADPTGEVSPASTAMDVLDRLEIPRTRGSAILDIGQRVTELADKFVQQRRDAAECYRLTGADPSDGSDAMLAREALDEVRRFRAEHDELEEAIAKVGEALDRIDAPQGATYAERIDRLYRELTDRASVERLDTAAAEDGAGARRELHIVLDHDTPASLMHAGPKFVEIEDERGRGLGGFEHRRDGALERIVIPVPYPVGPVRVQCPKGGTHCWPRNPSRDGTSCLKCGTTPEEAGDRRDATIKGLQDDNARLLEGRESARLGEDQFKAQRDAALHLLRWLIGDLIPSHLVDLTDDEETR